MHRGASGGAHDPYRHGYAGDGDTGLLGMGNDSYRTLVNGDDIAMAWSYLAETDQDAEDLVNALIVHARDRMGATSSQESGGGLLLTGDGIYVFIDRMDDHFVFIASTDPAAGNSLRSQMGV